jgi:hypothetical protein
MFSVRKSWPECLLQWREWKMERTLLVHCLFLSSFVCPQRACVAVKYLSGLGWDVHSIACVVAVNYRGLVLRPVGSMNSWMSRIRCWSSACCYSEQNQHH